MARQDLCCGKTRYLLWQDKISFVPRHKGIHKGARSAKPRAPLWRRREAPPPLCLGTREILSCHNRDLVLPQHTSCLATTEILSCHYRHCVFPISERCSFLPISERYLIFLRFSLVFYTTATRRQPGGNPRDRQLDPSGRPTQQEPFASRVREKTIPYEIQLNTLKLFVDASSSGLFIYELFRK